MDGDEAKPADPAPESKVNVFPLHCRECGHDFEVEVYLPMVLERFANLMMGVCCRRCGAEKIALGRNRQKDAGAEAAP